MQSVFHRLALTLTIAFAAPCIKISAQLYNPDIDVYHYSFDIEVNDRNDTITVMAGINYQFKRDAQSLTLDLAGKNAVGKGMSVSAIVERSHKLKFIHEGDKLTIYSPGKAGEYQNITIIYRGIPADGLIIAKNKYGHRGFFGDNWPNRAHNWLACVDDPSDKALVEFIITAPDHYKVVANGSLQKEAELPHQRKLTHWSESVPISPKVMVVGIADFAVGHPADVMGVPVWNYVYREDSVVGLKSYTDAVDILPFYISHIGPYPFEKCGNVQSKTRFGGLENAGAIFYFEGSVSDPGVESLMAHEIAHQWFGDAVTETEWKYLWLSEGFATYMTHCYLESRYGTDTLKSGLRKNREQVFGFEKRRLTAIVDTSVHSDYMQLLNPNNYQKGGWVLHMLRRKVGDSLFWKGIAGYYKEYRDKNATSADLCKCMEAASGQTLTEFFHQWLDRPGHPRLTVTRQASNGQLKSFTIDQQQEEPYTLDLEYSIDGKLYRSTISGKQSAIILPPGTAENAKIIFDPNVDLLAEIKE